MSSLPPIPAAPSGAPSDKLTIDTPEQTSLEFAIAGIGSRFLAIAFDTLIQVVAFLVILIAGIFGFRTAFPGGFDSPWFYGSLVLVGFALYYGYFAAFEALWNGQTPGKLVLRIRVIKDSGRPITPAESVGRNLLRIVDQLPFLYGIGLASVALSRQNKRLGDFVAGTIVVHERELQDVRPLWQAAPAASAVKYGAERISPEDFQLIEAFLNRRDALAPDVRFRMGEQIASRIKPMLMIPPDQNPSSERLLEAVAAERRSTARYI
ncbi:MAG: RDD family protein [Candidatus Acidiferrales bacterium]